jgi:hypothetical protein
MAFFTTWYISQFVDPMDLNHVRKIEFAILVLMVVLGTLSGFLAPYHSQLAVYQAELGFKND